jgi:hypothetical protein
MDNARPPLSVERFHLENTHPHAMALRLEPWGEQYSIAPGDRVEVLGRGPAGDALDLDWSDDVVTVYGWPGSMVYVRRDGIDVAPVAGAQPERHPVPRLPHAMRLREWLAAMRAPLP